MTNQKTYFAKVYSPTVSGTTTSGILSTLQDFVFDGFTWDINAGLGEVRLKFPRTFNDFGQGTDISLFNQFDIFVNDKESGQYGYQVYSGYIIEYNPVLTGPQEYSEVVLWGYPTEFSVKVLETGTDTTISYSSQDPSNILKDVMNRYDGKVSYTGASVATTNTSVSYTFKQNTILEAINQVIDLSPSYYYWRVGAENVLTFARRNTDIIDHTLYIGKDVSSIVPRVSAKELRNNFYFLGGGAPVYIKTSRTTSQRSFGKRITRQQDERVTVQETAAIIANSYLDFYDHPQINLEVTVVDSNGDSGGGYDIELFKPGQVVKIVDPASDPTLTYWDVNYWDNSYWDFPITSFVGIPMQIRSISYTLEKATLQLAFESPDFSKRIEDIIRNQTDLRTQDTPTTPTVV